MANAILYGKLFFKLASKLQKILNKKKKKREKLFFTSFRILHLFSISIGLYHIDKGGIVPMKSAPVIWT